MESITSAASRALALPELLEVILFYAVLPSSARKPNRLERKYLEQEKKKQRLAVASSTSPKELIAAKDLERCKKNAEGMRFILCSAQRVNRTWNDVISSSKDIQEALFLRWKDRGDRTPRFNPLLVSTFRWGYFHMGGEFPDRTDKFCDSLTYEKASWRNMYPLLPPFQQFSAHKFQTGGHFDESQHGQMSRIKLREPGATTMGMLFDVCEEWKEPSPNSGFLVRWELDWRNASFKHDRERRAAQKNNPFVTEFASEQPIALETPLDYLKNAFDKPAVSVSQITISLTNYNRFGTGRISSYNDGVGYPKLRSHAKEWNLDDVEWGPPMLDR